MKVYRKAREKYQFDDSFFNSTGSVTFPNLHNVRIFVQNINQRRDLINFPELAVRGSEINGIALETEIFDHLLDIYQKQNNLDIIQDILTWLNEKIGPEELNRSLKSVVEEFPPPIIFHDEIDSDTYLEETTEGVPNKHIFISSMINLWLSTANPAFTNHLELFDDTDLKKKTEYLQIINLIKDFFDTQPPFGPDNQNFLEMLQSLSIKEPHSIKGQLEYINERWGYLIGSLQYKSRENGPRPAECPALSANPRSP